MSLPGPVAIPVVFDVNVLVAACTGGDSPFRSWPLPPPNSGNPAADSLGVIVDAAEFALWLSPHIINETRRVLVDVLHWQPAPAQGFLQALQDAAHHSGGGSAHPPSTVGACPEWQDNFVLDLVGEVGAFMLVSTDADLISRSPCGGVPVITPAQFTGRVDGMRRHRNR